MTVTFVSLFSGCGGFDLGFIQAGFRCIGAFDIDPLAVRVHRRNLNVQATICDLTTIDVNHPELRADVLLAGSPCQGFSTAGKRNFDDPRNSLLLLGGQIAIRTRPKVFIAENVSGVVAGEHKRYWDLLHRTLRLAGYRTSDIYCEANKMGVPQRRKRVVLLAWLRDATFPLKLPVVNGGTVLDAIKSISGVPNHTPKRIPSNSQIAIIARHIHQGHKLSNVRGGQRAIHTWHIPEVFGKTSASEQRVLEALVKLRRRNRVRSVGDADPVFAEVLTTYLGQDVSNTLKRLVRKGYVRQLDRAFDLTHTFNGKFRRLSLNAPSPTVDTRFGDPKYFLHPTQSRGLTVREAARFQGFPDTFIFEGNQQAQYRLVGNAVPPPMAYQLALYVRDVILEGQ